MARTVMVILGLDGFEIEEFRKLDFDSLKSDIDLLAQQPHLDVLPCYRGKKLDYGLGYRRITVGIDLENFPMLHYNVTERAGVEGSTDHSNSVGRRDYTQEEVNTLRDRAA